jgi:hypothetical protein
MEMMESDVDVETGWTRWSDNSRNDRRVAAASGSRARSTKWCGRVRFYGSEMHA